MTLLAEDTDLWDTVFHEPPNRVRFVSRLARTHGRQILDVGCATGSLCRGLRRAGAETYGIDINKRFVEKALSGDPGGRYARGDMRCFDLRRTFDILVCVGTTFSYNLTNDDVQQGLRKFRAHLRPGGCLVIDVLNAAALLSARPFEPTRRHRFTYAGARAVATIRHRLHLKRQTISEQVSWEIGRAKRRDPQEELRLFFPQELLFHLDVAGFDRIRLRDSYANASQAFAGRRLIAVAFRADRSNGTSAQ